MTTLARRLATLAVFLLPALNLPATASAQGTSADGQSSQIRLTESGGFRSPIFAPDDESVLALWRGQLVELTAPYRATAGASSSYGPRNEDSRVPPGAQR